ncbi:MAG: hypothetical protein V4602_15140 [Pseudomonadota bacterium]
MTTPNAERLALDDRRISCLMALHDASKNHPERDALRAAMSALESALRAQPADAGEPVAWRDVEMMRLINLLRSNEGDSVTILCNNPDFNGQPNNAVVCNGGWTNWEDRRFSQDTLLDALSAAMIEYMRPDVAPSAASEPLYTSPQPADAGVREKEIIERLNTWLLGEIEQAQSRQRNAFAQGNDRLGEKYHGRHVALFDVKDRLSALNAPVVDPRNSDEGDERDAPLVDLVSRFSAALLAKLKAAEAKYGYNNAWMRDGWDATCQEHMIEHLAKGDPLDVAAYCAFMWHHGWATAPATPPQPAVSSEVWEALARIIDPTAEGDYRLRERYMKAGRVLALISEIPLIADQSAAMADAEMLRDIASAAERLLNADTFVHPTLSRSEAVAQATDNLRRKLGRWQMGQCASQEQP